MNAENLSKVGSRLVKRCGTRDPFSIARQLGIEVLFCENFGPLKGMYPGDQAQPFYFHKRKPERADAADCLCS